MPHTHVLDGARFAEDLKRCGVTVLFQTTALFNQRALETPELFAGLRYVLFGGETSDASAVRSLLDTGAPQNLLHAYGPTEATTFATCYRVTSVEKDATTIPIGAPISNTQIYILDRQQQPVPIGVAGELYIGGAGVALGYLNRPELTAERFIRDPFSAEPQARMYRTGDLGRWRPDGTIEFLGRTDNQIKIRGFRIELGEIEAQLTRHARIKQAAVIVREDTPGEKRLVAYAVPQTPAGADREEPAPLNAEALRAHLQAQLPEHMIPSAFVLLEHLPLTPSGKLERRALPAPGRDAYTRRQYEPPRGQIEEVLAGIWQQLLKVERIGRHDNFFELGGDSLHGLRLTAKIAEEFSVSVSPVVIFQCPTIRDLASLLETPISPGIEGVGSPSAALERGLI